MDRLVEAAQSRRLVIFAGAGVSAAAPACLPSWWDLDHAVVDALATVSSEVVGADPAKSLASRIKARQEEGRLPPEWLAETIVDRLGDSYFQVLRCLEGASANVNHQWMAELALSGAIFAIVTTNFDTLIERAFDEAGVPLRVCVDPSDFEEFTAELASGDRSVDSSVAVCSLLKLHGTATRPTTCVDTLAQRKRGLPGAVVRAVDAVHRQGPMLFIGFSGADFDADPNYLGFRKRALDPELPGILWLTQPGVAPLSAVKELHALYGESRAQFMEGQLPSWLDDSLSGFVHRVPPPFRMAPDAVQTLRATAKAQLKERATEWASGIGSLLTVIVLCDLAVAADDREAAREALASILASGSNIDLSSYGFALLSESLAGIERSMGYLQGALNRLRAVIPHAESAGDRGLYVAVLTNAASLLRELGESDECEKLLHTAIAINDQREGADTTARQIHLKSELAECLRAQGHPIAEWHLLLEEALALAKKNGLEEARASLLNKTALLLLDKGGAEAGVDLDALLAEAEATYTRLGHEAGRAGVMLTRARRLLSSGHVPEGLELALRAREIAAVSRSPQLLASADLVRGSVLMQTLRIAEAAAVLRTAVEDGALNANIEIGTFLGLQQNYALAQLHLGDKDGAQATYRKALEAAKKHKVSQRIADLSINLGNIIEVAGDLEGALELYNQAEDIQRRAGRMTNIAQVGGNKANVLFRMGRFDEAEERYLELQEVFRAAGDVDGLVRTLANLAALQQHAKKWHSAIETFKLSVSTMRAQHNMLALPNVLEGLGSAYFGANQHLNAAATFLELSDLCLSTGALSAAGRALYFCAASHERAGDAKSACIVYREVLAMWEPLEDAQRPAAFVQTINAALLRLEGAETADVSKPPKALQPEPVEQPVRRSVRDLAKVFEM
jgi:tetratricopeptide (TPR) repeat protein